jgi:hypothetical protein
LPFTKHGGSRRQAMSLAYSSVRREARRDWFAAQMMWCSVEPGEGGYLRSWKGEEEVFDEAEVFDAAPSTHVNVYANLGSSFSSV